MNGRVVFWATTLMVVVASTAAADVNVQLNLRYTDPADESQGGTWQLLGGSTGGGIAGLVVLVDGINNDAASAGISGFEVFASQQVSTVIEVATGSDLQPPLDLDVGLGPGTTGNVEDDLFPGNSPAIWANNALFAAGTFGATRPSFRMTLNTLQAGANEFSGTSAVAATFGVLAVRGDGVATDGLPLGDANRDGVIDGNDFLILSSNFNSPGGWDQGDFNSDGFVDNADLAILGIVPEPGACALLSLAVLCGVGMRRRD